MSLVYSGLLISSPVYVSDLSYPDLLALSLLISSLHLGLQFLTMCHTLGDSYLGKRPSSTPLSSLVLRDLEADKWSSGQGEYQLVSRRTQVCPHLLPLRKQMPRVHCRTVLTYATSSLNRLLFTWGRKVCTYLKGICYLSLYL